MPFNTLVPQPTWVVFRHTSCVKLFGLGMAGRARVPGRTRQKNLPLWTEEMQTFETPVSTLIGVFHIVCAVPKYACSHCFSIFYFHSHFWHEVDSDLGVAGPGG